MINDQIVRSFSTWFIKLTRLQSILTDDYNIGTSTGAEKSINLANAKIKVALDIFQQSMDIGTLDQLSMYSR